MKQMEPVEKPKGKKRGDRKVLSLEKQHHLFVEEGIDERDGDEKCNKSKEKADVTWRFFCCFIYPAQVQANHVWHIYRNGLFYKNLGPGPHVLFNWYGFFGRWQVYRVNLRTVLLEAEAEGRVKGPALPKAIAQGANAEIACNVIAVFHLVCKIANIEKFFSHQQPLGILSAAFHNMVIEMINELPYDQYGQWAVILREKVKNRLTDGPESAERLIGVKVEQVYVDDVFADSEHDEQTLLMYQKIEEARRELEQAEAYVAQGKILKIPPALLALRDSAVGQQLLASDTEIQRLMIAAGLNPAVTIQPIADAQSQLGRPNMSSVGYLQPPQWDQAGNSPAQLPQGSRQPSNISGPPSGPIFPISGELRAFHEQPTQANAPILPFERATGPSMPQSEPLAPFDQAGWPAMRVESPVDPERQELELTELAKAGFQWTGRGQITPTFDNSGRPIPGSQEWALEVYMPRGTRYLGISFRCPQGYPMVAPRVKVKHPGGSDWQEKRPNTIVTWGTSSLLVQVALEINENTLD